MIGVQIQSIPVKYSELKEGDLLITDDVFDCIEHFYISEVKKDENNEFGIYCMGPDEYDDELNEKREKILHNLKGQIKDEYDDTLVGVEKIIVNVKNNNGVTIRCIQNPFIHNFNPKTFKIDV